MSLILCLLRSQQLRTQSLILLQAVARHLVAPSKNNRVTTPVQTHKVVKSKTMTALAQMIGLPLLPIPLSPRSPSFAGCVNAVVQVNAGLHVERHFADSELCRISLPVHQDLENTRSFSLRPKRSPILSTYPKTVIPFFRNFDFCLCIFGKGCSQTMGEKIT